MQKNTAGQKFVVFAFNRTTNVPLTGDAANITANLQIDFGSSTGTNDVTPAELEDGFYSFDATQAETNGDSLVIYPASSTGDIQVIGVPAVIYTVSAGSPDEVVQSANHTAGIAAIPTTPMRGTDNALLSADISLTAGAVDNVTLTATTTALTNVINAASVVASVSGNVDGSVGSVTGGATSAAQTTAQNDLDIITGADGVNLLSGTQSKIDAIPTTAMRGTDSANTVAPDNSSITAIKAKTDSLTFTVSNKVDTNVQSVNDVTVTGTGTVGDEWGP